MTSNRVKLNLDQKNTILHKNYLGLKNESNPNTQREKIITKGRSELRLLEEEIERKL
jgi:hypothetical protein